MKKNNKNNDSLTATDCAIAKNQKMLYSSNMKTTNNNKETTLCQK